jgi:hypothetical protein
MAHRPFTRRQALQNRRFLEALALTGNARAAARALGVHRATYTKRRAKCAAFAQNWDAALAIAHASINSPPRPSGRGPGGGPPHRTSGGEPVTVRLKSGRCQVRRAPPGRLTRAAEQLFLAALAATFNVRLAAAAAGFSHPVFYTKAKKSPAFAREMRAARKMGWERVEAAALSAGLADSAEDDAWRHNDPPPIPPMTPAQALQLLYLHEKSVHQSWDKPHRRRRRGESDETHRQRLAAMWTHEKKVEAEEEALRRAARWEQVGDWNLPGDELPAIPSLEQVTGWSKAKGKPPHDPDKALFGGWRLRDWKKGKLRPN